MLRGLGELGTISQAFFPPPWSRDVPNIRPKALKRGLAQVGSSVQVHLTLQLHRGHGTASSSQLHPQVRLEPGPGEARMSSSAAHSGWSMVARLWRDQFPHLPNQASVMSCPSQDLESQENYGGTVVLGIRGECYLSRDCTGMGPSGSLERKAKPLVLKRVPGWGKETKAANCRAETILSKDRGVAAEARRETPCVYSGCPGSFD